MIGFASAPHPTLSRRDVDRRDFFGRSKSRHPRFVDHCSSRRAHWGAEDPFVQDVLGAIRPSASPARRARPTTTPSWRSSGTASRCTSCAARVSPKVMHPRDAGALHRGGRSRSPDRCTRRHHRHKGGLRFGGSRTASQHSRAQLSCALRSERMIAAVRDRRNQPCFQELHRIEGADRRQIAGEPLRFDRRELAGAALREG
jgi:hypothetical protein